MKKSVNTYIEQKLLKSQNVFKIIKIESPDPYSLDQ